MKKTVLITLILLISTTIFAQKIEKSSFTDKRDGQTYKTVSFENVLSGEKVIWMAENLNYKVAGDCRAYDNKESYRENLGMLYSWHVAQNVCPDGWHLPTDKEWEILVNNFGSLKKAGTKLKSVNIWYNGGNGTNESGFNVLPAGFSNATGKFIDISRVSDFWTSSAYKSRKAWGYRFTSKDGRILHFTHALSNGASVRCVKN